MKVLKTNKIASKSDGFITFKMPVNDFHFGFPELLMHLRTWASRDVSLCFLIHDFQKQNTRGKVSKIAITYACHWQIESKSTNHGPIPWCTVPLKCKLNTRNSILDPRFSKTSRIEARVEFRDVWGRSRIYRDRSRIYQVEFRDFRVGKTKDFSRD